MKVLRSKQGTKVGEYMLTKTSNNLKELRLYEKK